MISSVSTIDFSEKIEKYQVMHGVRKKQEEHKRRNENIRKKTKINLKLELSSIDSR